jgi:hypothetical protein
MNEEFLHYLWKYQLFKQHLKSSDQEDIIVKKIGTKNTDAGPDFSNALIKIGNSIWAGNVEIHIKTSDWFKHNHQIDPKYKTVILHVVYENDLEDKQIQKINTPMLELKEYIISNTFQKYQAFMGNLYWIPCENQINEVSRFKLYYFISKLAIERLEYKSERIQRLLLKNKNNLEQSFYELLAHNFGFKTNSEAFEMLAESLLLTILAKQKNSLLQIEALLFGQAGMLNKDFKDAYPNKLKKEYGFLKVKYMLNPISSHIWKFLRLRPSNFPTIRLAQFAMLIYNSSALLSQIIESETIDQITHFFKIETSEYWNTHYNFDLKTKNKKKILGQQATNLILINTVIPFLFVYGKFKDEEKFCKKALNFLEILDRENNHIIRKWKSLGITTSSAFFTQALIHLKHFYCDKKRCLECQVGHELLKG